MKTREQIVQERMRKAEQLVQDYLYAGMATDVAVATARDVVLGKIPAPKVPRFYCHLGVSGLVERRKNAETGTEVGLYNAKQANMDDEAGPWATVCEDHGHIVNHGSLALARSHLAAPMGWCDSCNGSEPNRNA